jgi:hypothetical protein
VRSDFREEFVNAVFSDLYVEHFFRPLAIASGGFGLSIRRRIVLLVPNFLEEEEAIAMFVGTGGSGGVQMEDLPVADGAVPRPGGKAGGVG